MIAWLQLPKVRRIQILNQANNRTGIRPHALEKDWWVTLVLKAIFDTQWAQYLVFKGGTSLTKSWKLIERFSEDIDLSIDKEFLGFSGDPNKSKIERLRRRSSEFISIEFKEELQRVLLALGVSPDQFEVTAKYAGDSIRDLQVLEIQYRSVLEPDPNPYLKDKVVIEVGARSLREPSSPREITSIISEVFPSTSFAAAPFLVQTVDPKRTFLEKAFLLHELFYKGEIGCDRMSRHFYDLERLMDTEHATMAMQDKELYSGIISHREIFNKVTGVDYASHQSGAVNFIPPDDLKGVWEADYKAMQENMIYGESLPFQELIERLQELQNRFRQLEADNEK